MAPKFAGASQQRLGLGDHWRVPERRILLGKRDIFAIGARAARPPGFGVKHQREQAQRLRLVRQQLGDEPGEEHRLLGEIAASDIGAARIASSLR